MTMITPSYLGETIEYSSLHACRSTLEDPTQFDTAQRRPIAQNVVTGDVVFLPEGTYYVVSTYGDVNSVVRSDVQVQPGKLSQLRRLAGGTAHRSSRPDLRSSNPSGLWICASRSARTCR